jgi:hypothetical protein
LSDNFCITHTEQKTNKRTRITNVLDRNMLILVAHMVSNKYHTDGLQVEKTTTILQK